MNGWDIFIILMRTFLVGTRKNSKAPEQVIRMTVGGTYYR